MKNLGQQIRVIRTQRGIGLNDYAKQLGVSSGYLSNLETGKSDTVQLSLLETLMQDLGLHLSDEQSEYETEVDYRISGILTQLKALEKEQPEAADYLLACMERGLQMFTRSQQ